MLAYLEDMRHVGVHMQPVRQPLFTVSCRCTRHAFGVQGLCHSLSVTQGTFSSTSLQCNHTDTTTQATCLVSLEAPTPHNTNALPLSPHTHLQ